MITIDLIASLFYRLFYLALRYWLRLFLFVYGSETILIIKPDFVLWSSLRVWTFHIEFIFCIIISLSERIKKTNKLYHNVTCATWQNCVYFRNSSSNCFIFLWCARAQNSLFRLLSKVNVSEARRSSLFDQDTNMITGDRMSINTILSNDNERPY